MTARVWFTPRAAVQLAKVDEWWRSNRLAAPRLFDDEIRAAIALLAATPETGRSHAHRQIHGLRRLYLSGTRYHVYYVHDAEAREVVVLAVWSALRGKGPPLRRP